MTLAGLLKTLDIIRKHGPLEKDIKGIAYDSRLVEGDYLFVAVRGFSVDGHDYIDDAISRGATAIIAEQTSGLLDGSQRAFQAKIAYIEVPDARKALADLSAAFYGKPSARLSLVGITGTNGKTTTSYITRNIMNEAGMHTGLLGTISYMTGKEEINALNTTPESLDLQRYLSEMVAHDMDYAIMEVSSHALALKRVEGCSFRVVAFINFTQDHLDFHGTMDEYFDVKRSIFKFLDSSGTAVLNIDDPKIEELSQKLHCNVVTCGLDERAEIRAVNIKEHRTCLPDRQAQSTEHRQGIPSGISFDVQMPDSTFRIDSAFVGSFNVYNILMSIGIAYALGIDEGAIKRGTGNAKPVRGRFERVDKGQNYLCIVDYAHTDDALRKILEEAGKLTKGKIITVFGCGGDRDRSKRPLMGQAASELSDFVIVTSDNPRNEDPDRIISDIVAGLNDENYMLIPDRREAIQKAVSLAHEGDTVLIAGKGHEDYQEIKGRRHYFSDKQVLTEAINNIKNGS
jgi:UDP-N-acetylmuramoyl-L-alanyl-D-glutamate--2,6-diaminopimelate ligase